MSKFQVGDVVEWYHAASDSWHPGIVLKTEDAGCYIMLANPYPDPKQQRRGINRVWAWDKFIRKLEET